MNPVLLGLFLSLSLLDAPMEDEMRSENQVQTDDKQIRESSMPLFRTVDGYRLPFFPIGVRHSAIRHELVLWPLVTRNI